MKPKSFRIYDFRSIVDSGKCILSRDNITALAGQNEAGKTAVLLALRDFDLPVGEKPKTHDFYPEGKYDAKPRVSIEFETDVEELKSCLKDKEKIIPDAVFDAIEEAKSIFITKNLLDGHYELDENLHGLWPIDWGQIVTPQINENKGETVKGEEENIEEENLENEENKESAERFFSSRGFAAYLHYYWPSFVYFDSFQNSLPREVQVEAVLPSKTENATPSTQSSTGTAVKTSAPQPVKDFITLSGMNINRVSELESQDKTLGNYLTSCGANITGDFLTYWKQTTDNQESVELKVRHLRDAEGILKFSFFVTDKVKNIDLYPEQRSKGFLWFLSFYLRLAAEEVRNPNRERVILVDEPGSYLHARAQLDVLHLFEDRLGKSNIILYSTHSPYLLPEKNLHRLRIIVKKEDLGTLVLDKLTHPALSGDSFSDTLRPIMYAIGLDIFEGLKFARERNLLVEGMSDFFYLKRWLEEFNPTLSNEINIFPCRGAPTTPTFASLFIGWGLAWAVLLDRDQEGEKAKEEFQNKFGTEDKMIVQPRNCICIEDFFSSEDFKKLLKLLDERYTLETNEKASVAIKRQGINKVLLARTYSEEATGNGFNLTQRTQDGIKGLLLDIKKAFET